MKVKFAQSCPTLSDPMDSTVHAILQARILERVTFPFSRGSCQPRDWTQVCHIAGGFFTSWATKEALYSPLISLLYDVPSCMDLVDRLFPLQPGPDVDTFPTLDPTESLQPIDYTIFKNQMSIVRVILPYLLEFFFPVFLG